MAHKSNIRIQNDAIYFQKHDVEVRFMRTLRIPDNGKKYPLPPGFGTFPIRRVHDYIDRVPYSWRERGGVFLPMYQREAMWLSFSCPSWRPRALQVGVGKVCAVSGKKWSGELTKKKQNYMVVPKQPWLDGIATGHGTIRQFVAMPLGMGYTVEGQITGKEEFGGVQLKVFEPRHGRFPTCPPPPAPGRFVPRSALSEYPTACAPSGAAAPQRKSASMGLAAGGRMKQKIYQDSYGIDTWDSFNTSRVFVHLVNSEMWREITGEEAPHSPVTAREYEEAGLPWYDIYDEYVPAVHGKKAFKKVKSVAQKDVEHFGEVISSSGDVDVDDVYTYAMNDPKGVYDGNW
jgi:hypothetical protein